MSSQPEAQKNPGSLPLVIPEGIRYNCSGCGRCCGGWAIGLTEADYGHVKDVDWGSLHPDLAGRELFVHRQQEHAAGTASHPHFTKAEADGSCPFLIDNLCFIHKTLGEEKKPINCRVFPYTFVATPGGIFVGLVYGSMAAVANQGELLIDQRAHLEHMWRVNVECERAMGRASDEVANAAASIVDSKDISFTINLAPGTALQWREYLLIEDRMIKAIMTDDYIDVFQCLLSISDIIAEAVRIKDSGNSLEDLSDFQPNTSKWRRRRPGIFEKFVFNLLCFRSFSMPPLILRSNLTMGSRSSAIAPDTIMAGARAVLFDKLELPVVGLANIRQARLLKTPAPSLEINEFFRRFLYLKVFSKTFCGSALAGLSMSTGCNILAGNILSSIMFAKACALHYNRQQLNLADFQEAFFHIDRGTIGMHQMPADKSAFYDQGFSTANLFSRLIAETSSCTNEPGC